MSEKKKPFDDPLYLLDELMVAGSITHRLIDGYIDALKKRGEKAKGKEHMAKALKEAEKAGKRIEKVRSALIKAELAYTQSGGPSPEEVMEKFKRITGQPHSLFAKVIANRAKQFMPAERVDEMLEKFNAVEEGEEDADRSDHSDRLPH